MNKVTYQIIGMIESIHPDKFGVPRQSGLTTTRACIKLHAPWNHRDWIEGIAAFSHCWILWHAHLIPSEKAPQPKVRPPRLGGNEKKGSLSTRSLFRPNPLGLSAVKILEVHYDRAEIWVEGIDVVHGTPVIDIKPYIVWCDAKSNAYSDWAQAQPSSEMQVVYSEEAHATLNNDAQSKELKKYIYEILCLDPRPSYHEEALPDREYGMSLGTYNIRFQKKIDAWYVTKITQCDENETLK